MTVINTEDNLLSTIETPFGPSEVIIDNDGDLWVLCTSGSLIEVNTDSKTITNTFTNLTTSGFNERMAFDPVINKIYYLGASNSSFTGQTSVFVVDLNLENPGLSLLFEDGFALYGIGVNPETNEIYIGDSNGFQSTGTVLTYSPDGEETGQFASGIGPNGFIFLKN